MIDRDHLFAAGSKKPFSRVAVFPTAGLLGAWLLTTLTHVAYGANYALVVGVNSCPEYMGAKGAAVKQLAGAEADAKAFAELLQRQYGFAKDNIQPLLGEEATYAKIKQAFADRQKLSADDQFVFYFAGHGTQVPDEPPYPSPYDEDDHLDEALCPSNAGRENKSINGVNYQMAVNLIVDDELAVWLHDLPTSRVTVVLDCCHSGTGIKGPQEDGIQARSLPMIPLQPTNQNQLMNRARVKQPWHALQERGKGSSKTIIALYACRADQPAVERRFNDLKGPSDMRGQFTKLLIDYIDTNGPGTTLDQASKEVKKNFENWKALKEVEQRSAGSLPEAYKWAKDQTPSFEPAQGGALPLVR
jgi:hypothetical protein